MKRYFIHVKTYLGTNRLETELNKYVKDKYDQAIINDESVDAMNDDIKCKIDELAKKYPRCKTKILTEIFNSPRIYCYQYEDFSDSIIVLYLIVREYMEGVGL